MILEEMLKLHDILEKKASSRPWSTTMEQVPWYKQGFVWARRPERKVIWDNEDDMRYLAFCRNLMPEFVKEIRKMKEKIRELENQNSEFNICEQNKKI